MMINPLLTWYVFIITQVHNPILLHEWDKCIYRASKSRLITLLRGINGKVFGKNNIYLYNFLYNTYGATSMVVGQLHIYRFNHRIKVLYEPSVYPVSMEEGPDGMFFMQYKKKIQATTKKGFSLWKVDFKNSRVLKIRWTGVWLAVVLETTQAKKLVLFNREGQQITQTAISSDLFDIKCDILHGCLLSLENGKLIRYQNRKFTLIKNNKAIVCKKIFKLNQGFITNCNKELFLINYSNNNQLISYYNKPFDEWISSPSLYVFYKGKIGVIIGKNKTKYIGSLSFRPDNIDVINPQPYFIIVAAYKRKNYRYATVNLIGFIRNKKVFSVVRDVFFNYSKKLKTSLSKRLNSSAIGPWKVFLWRLKKAWCLNNNLVLGFFNHKGDVSIGVIK